MFLLVIVRPNSAFATVRDDFERYFWWSLGGFVLVTAIAHHTPYFQYASLYRDIPVDLYILLAPPLSFIPIISWLIGRKKDGIRHWRAVFSVLGYAWTVYFLLLLGISIIIGTTISYFYFELHMHNFDGAIFGYVLSAGIFIWFMILMVKAIKVANNTVGIGKAIFVAILGYIVILIFSPLVQAPF